MTSAIFHERLSILALDLFASRRSKKEARAAPAPQLPVLAHQRTILSSDAPRPPGVPQSGAHEEVATEADAPS